MIWWIAKPSRARDERLAIAELQSKRDWLQAVIWRMGPDARLIADFELEHLGRVIPMTVTYPSFFPDMPPQVCPVEAVRLSGHQYGAGGELCLEYRPDNWDPAYTGAMMIESAYRLLTGEAPNEAIAGQVENAHRSTVGQEVRGAKLRFLLAADAEASFKTLLPYQAIELEISEHSVAKHWLAVVRRLGPKGNAHWECGPDIPRNRIRSGYALKLGAVLRSKMGADFTFLKAVIEAAEDQKMIGSLAQSDDEVMFLITCDGNTKLLALAPGTGERQVHVYRTVQVPPDANRLPVEYAQLQDASVAIVGCGSLGSKIAASLARAGVGKFVLVDGDLLFPANLVRNDLDWRTMGLHKPDAVAERVRKIRPSAAIDTSRIVLRGQESSAATEGALGQIAKCQVIIDATADAQVFNLCAAVARDEKKVLVWGEVFGGGVGGLVMRARPHIEPVPHAARRQILAWCAEHGREAGQNGNFQYGLQLDEDSPPLIADDADVTIIAAHMSRLALDALARTESIFPHSAYAVGLKAGWIFEAPFETWPIELKTEGEWGPEVEDQRNEHLIALAEELFPTAPRTEPSG